MARSGRAVMAFAAPVLALSLAGLAAWIGFGREETFLGPMRILPMAPLSAPPPFDPDAPPPTTLEPISPLEAEVRNALLPYSHAPMTLGARFQAMSDAPNAALECMTAAVYYEAGREPLAGKRAVAQVILNRTVTAPFPRTVCGVIQQGAPRPGCQFTFMCDGSMGRRPDPTGWAAAREVASAALSGSIDPEVGMATHYHADYVLPVWAGTMLKLVKIGRHIFYRWPGMRSLPDASTSAVEPDPLAGSAAEGPIAVPEAPASPAADAVSQPPPSAPSTTGAAPSPPSETTPTAPTERPTTAPPRPPPAPRRAIPDRSLRIGPI